MNEEKRPVGEENFGIIAKPALLDQHAKTSPVKRWKERVRK